MSVVTDQQFVTNTILEKYRAKGNKNKDDKEKDDDLVIGSPLSIVSSPLAATRTQTNTIGSDNNSDTSDDVYEQILIENQVAVVLDSVTYVGIVLYSSVLDGRKHQEIVYNENFDEEEVDAIELSRR